MKAIEVQHLTHCYNGLCAVNDISFAVEPGEIFCLLGTNGAGKTTTMRMLTGQLRPTSGKAWVAGCDVASEQHCLKPKIGAVFEHQNAYEGLSARDSLSLSAWLYGVKKARVQKVLEQVGLAGRARDKTKMYSNGMKQRLLIARALLREPKVLFPDEPTRGLEPNVAHDIRTIAADLAKQGVTVFLTIHRMEEANHLSAPVAVIDQGRIVARCSASLDLDTTRCSATGIPSATHRPDTGLRTDLPRHVSLVTVGCEVLGTSVSLTR